MDQTPLEFAITASGGIAKFAAKIGLSRQAVYGWKRVPAERVVAVETATGISRNMLRPDLYKRRRGA